MDKAEGLNLYIVRHGETEWNVEKRFQGRKDSPLTELGKQQAKQLGETLSGIQWEAVYVSPLGRCVDTAKIIVKNGQPIILNEALQEMCFGNWEGQLHQEIIQTEPFKFEAFWQEPDHYITSSGEDFYEVQERVIGELQKMIHKHPSGNVLIISHTVVIKILMAYFDDRSIEALWNPPSIKPASLCQVAILNGGKSEILLYGHVGRNHE